MLLRSLCSLSCGLLTLRSLPSSFQLLSTPLLEEIAIMWRTDFTQSAHRRFREVDRGLTDSSRVGDLHASWLGPLFLVERARESMLWTWAIARMGGLDGMWGEEEREELREMLGLSEGEGEEKREERVEIPKFVQGETRPMMEWENLVGQMEEMEVEGPQVTELLWCESSASCFFLVPERLGR